MYVNTVSKLFKHHTHIMCLFYRTEQILNVIAYAVVLSVYIHYVHAKFENT